MLELRFLVIYKCEIEKGLLLVRLKCLYSLNNTSFLVIGMLELRFLFV